MNKQELLKYLENQGLMDLVLLAANYNIQLMAQYLLNNILVKDL